MQPHDLGLIATAGEVRVSPDGRRVIYALTTVDLEANAYRTRLWLVAGSGDERPLPLTAGTKADVLPRWSPDGRLVAWVSTRRPETAVYLMAVDGPGEPVLVASWADEISELAWSPTGDRLAFVARVRDPDQYGPPGRTTPEADMPPRRVTRLNSQHNGDGWVFDRRPQVHVVPIDGSSPPQAITDIEAGASGVAWSPDGSRLAYVAATHDRWDIDGCNDVWVVDAAGGEATRLTETAMSWSHPAWSPDSTRIAALAVPTPDSGPRHGQLWTIDVTSGEAERLVASLDRNLMPYGASRPPVWIGDELLVGAEDEGRLHVAAAGRTGWRLVVGGERVVRSYDASGGTLAFVASTVTEPSELWVTDEVGKLPVRVLTDHGATLRSRVALARPERFVATSTDGAEVECWAIAPLGAETAGPYPTVLNIHGGPFTQYGYGFFDEFQLQVGAGIGVIYCNPRGSSGYSEAWGRAIRWPEATDDPGSGWGGVDYDDVMACVDEALKRYEWIDPDRLGVQGGSYGGYLTSWIVGHTDRFVAAVSERAVNNLVTMEHNSDISGFFREYTGWTHLERPDIFARQSPATYVGAMTTPMLLLHSEDDLRCPISQAEELFVALRLLGRQPELVRFPAENHDLSRNGSPKHRVMRAEIILDWFRRHLTAPDHSPAG
jgi:dipeptidyl aminopeptidase/acylaminoacyl peptidase